MRRTLRPESVRLVKGRRRKPFPTGGPAQGEAEHAAGQRGAVQREWKVGRKESSKEDEVREGQGLGAVRVWT